MLVDDVMLFSVFDVWLGIEVMEREVFDMYGIVFMGYFDLFCIFMFEDWVGYLLCKDYEVGIIFVQFKSVGDR